MRLAIGTAQFGMHYGISNINGKTSFQEAEKIVHLAKINHIDCIDTALAYGDSESVLGRLRIKDFKLITKIPPINKAIGGVDRQIADMVSESLKRLGLSKLFGILAHDSSELLTENGDKLYESMRRLKKLGLVEKIGLSAYSSEEITNLIDRYEFDIVQLPFNVFDNRPVTSGLFEKLKLRNIEVHVRSIFLQGLLLIEPSKIPQKFNRWKKSFEDWDDYIKKSKLTRLSACLAYVKSFKEIDRIVVGVEYEAQLAEILSAYDIDDVNNFPNFEIKDELLINPGKWNEL